MGVSPFSDVETLLKEKTKGYEKTPNPYMLRGKELEPFALEKFCEETGLIMFPMVGKHETYDWMAASFDGVTICRTEILEIKHPGKTDHECAMNGKTPEKYYPQVQHQIEVSGLDFSYYYSVGYFNTVLLKVKRDQSYIEKMLEKELEFLNLMKLCA
jgi:putative phage-type endonuclease